METKIENSIINIKNKMTEIRKNRKNCLIYQNYYNNCDFCKEIYALYGSNSIVFWNTDNSVIRGYFYSSDKDELRTLIGKLPVGCIIDYITKTKDEFINFLTGSKLKLLFEMHKMSLEGLTEKEKEEIKTRKAFFKEKFNGLQYVRSANLNDLETIYNKLYEIFDPRESHLPTKAELKEFIENKWVSVYDENGVITGFHIFKVEHGAYYGYQIWNGSGFEGCFSMILNNDNLYEQYIHEHNITYRPGYGWVNAKNKKAVRIAKWEGKKFSGLYDFIFERTDT